MKCSNCNTYHDDENPEVRMDKWVQVGKYKHFKRVCNGCYSINNESESDLRSS
jgi:thymidine kinase